jgi:hypothetical protein
MGTTPTQVAPTHRLTRTDDAGRKWILAELRRQFDKR